MKKSIIKVSVFVAVLALSMSSKNVAINKTGILLENIAHLALADTEYRPITEGHLFDCLGWGDPCSSIYQPEQTEQW